MISGANSPHDEVRIVPNFHEASVSASSGYLQVRGGRKRGRAMANLIATLELAHRLRENAHDTSLPSYAKRMLEVAADLESFVYYGEEAPDQVLRQIKAANR